MFDCDDDVVVIALWIIAIGFIILAIDKTTRLNDSSNHAIPLFPQEPPQPPQPQSFSAQSLEDQQFNQIQQQLKQLGSGLNELKRNLSR